MTITVSDTVLVESLTFDKVFMKSLSIVQTEETDSSKTPCYVLKINYRIFATDSTGKRHFQDKVRNISIMDYYTLAATKAATGDLDLYNAMIAIEKALGAIVNDQGVLGTVTVTL